MTLVTVRAVLERAGFEVEAVGDGKAALATARSLPWDLIVLDVLLPSVDGLSVCRALRRESRVPILMLTAMSDEADKVMGLESGADDYLTKPFGSEELVARVKAILRRAEMAGSETGREQAVGTVLARRSPQGSLEIDLISRRATCSGRHLRLTPKEFDLLAYLMHHPGEPVSREQLLKQVWGYDVACDARTVSVHVRWLREKLEEDPSDPQIIRTVKGMGYQFTA